MKMPFSPRLTKRPSEFHVRSPATLVGNLSFESHVPPRDPSGESVSGTRGSFAGRDEAPNPGENEQGQSAEPCGQAERSRKPMCDHVAHRDQGSREEQEHAHPVESSERQVVRAQKDHQSRKKPV